MSIEMSAGVLVAELIEGMKFALGPTMVVRRNCLDEAGGFRCLGPYHADDFTVGNLIAAGGQRVCCPPTPLITMSLIRHFSRPCCTRSGG